MSYSRLGQLGGARRKWNEKERKKIEDEKKSIKQLDRSPSDAVSNGAAEALSGSTLRGLVGQPVEALGEGPFKDKIRSLLDGNLKDGIDNALRELSPLGSQMFTNLMNITNMDPNRAIFDFVQRGAERLFERVDVELDELSNVTQLSQELRDLIVEVLPSQGEWFSDPDNGFRNNVVNAVQNIDGLDSSLASVIGRLESGSMPQTGELDAVRSALESLREDLVPVNADRRPSYGVDHPQSAVLVAVSQLRRKKQELEACKESLSSLHEAVSTQKTKLPQFFGDANVRTRGSTGARELQKFFRRFQEYSTDMRATLSHAAGSGGVGQVFNSQEDWVTQIEAMLGVLDRPLLSLSTVSEDGGVFDSVTQGLQDHFDEFASRIGSVTDQGSAGLESAVDQLLNLASTALGGTGLDISSVDSILGSITSEAGDVGSYLSGIQDAIQGGGFDFLDGTIPKLGQVTNFLRIMDDGDLDTSIEYFESGVLFDEGLSMANVRSVDSIGKLGEELRFVAQALSGGEVTILTEARLERLHSELEKEQRRKAREAQGKGEAIADAEEELNFRLARHDELDREARLVEEGVSET